MISEITIKEFQQVVAEDYGRELSFQEARKILTDMVGYFDLLAKIDFRRKMNLENSDAIL
jgi:hypothetical protein